MKFPQTPAVAEQLKFKIHPFSQINWGKRKQSNVILHWVCSASQFPTEVAPAVGTLAHVTRSGRNRLVAFTSDTGLMKPLCDEGDRCTWRRLVVEAVDSRCTPIQTVRNVRSCHYLDNDYVHLFDESRVWSAHHRSSNRHHEVFVRALDHRIYASHRHRSVCFVFLCRQIRK